MLPRDSRTADEIRNCQLNSLLRASSRAAKFTVSPMTVFLAPRQSDIAARIGTRREPVAREMKSLERAGLLKRSRGALEIVDAVALQLASPKPSKTVVSTLLKALPHVASIATLASAIISAL